MKTRSMSSGLALAMLLACGAALPVTTAQADKPRMGSDGGHRDGGGTRESGGMPGGRVDGGGRRGGRDDGAARGGSGGGGQDYGARNSSGGGSPERGSRGRLGSSRDDGNRDRYQRSYHTRDGDRPGRGRYDNSYRGRDAYRARDYGRGDGRRYYDNRYDHGHYYPSRGSYVSTLPYRHVIVHHRHERYYYGDGIWYRPYGGRYIVTRPAIGLFVTFLPAYATTVWFGGDPYYYANDVYYAWRPSRREYEVVDPPDSERSGPADDPEDVYVYPREGQSPEQQDRDRYECHRWAVDQTGFDPSEAGGGVDRSDRADKRDDYSRALAACLDGRGYTVR